MRERKRKSYFKKKIDEDEREREKKEKREGEKERRREERVKENLFNCEIECGNPLKQLWLRFKTDNMVQ